MAVDLLGEPLQPLYLSNKILKKKMVKSSLRNEYIMFISLHFGTLCVLSEPIGSWSERTVYALRNLLPPLLHCLRPLMLGRL